MKYLKIKPKTYTNYKQRGLFSRFNKLFGTNWTKPSDMKEFFDSITFKS